MANINSSKPKTDSNPSSFGDIRLLREAQAAQILNKPVSWMQVSRHRGDGPPYLKLGRTVRYDMADLIAWVKTQKRTSTAQG